MNVAILGAAGAVGRNIVEPLVAAGHRVRVVGRRADVLEAAFAGRAEVVAVDLTDPAGARRAVAGTDAALYLVGQPYDHFERHAPLTATAVAAAKAEGVGRFVHISTVYPYGLPRATPVAETQPREPHTRKGGHRKAQEDVVLGAHDPSGMRTLVLRPGDFYGPHADLSFIKGAFDGAIANKACDLIGPIDTPHEFVFMPDLAATIVALLPRDDAFGTAYNVPSAGATTTRAFAEAVYAEAGVPFRKRVVNKTMIRLLGLGMPLMRELVEMHYLWTSPVILDGTKLRGVLGDVPTTSYAEGIRRTLASMRQAAGRVA
jgi:nucleoside-diphosphate-sugar epimerase